MRRRILEPGLPDSKPFQYTLAQRRGSRLTFPCFSSPSAFAPRPGKAKTQKTPQIPPLFFASSNIFRMESASSKFPSTTWTFSRDDSCFAAGDFAFRVNAKIWNGLGFVSAWIADISAFPCFPVAPVTKRTFASIGRQGEDCVVY